MNSVWQLYLGLQQLFLRSEQSGLKRNGLKQISLVADAGDAADLGQRALHPRAHNRLLRLSPRAPPATRTKRPSAVTVTPRGHGVDVAGTRRVSPAGARAQPPRPSGPSARYRAGAVARREQRAAVRRESDRHRDAWAARRRCRPERGRSPASPPVRTRHTSISDTVLPSAPVRALSRFATASSDPSGLTADPERAARHRNFGDESVRLSRAARSASRRTDTSSVPPFAGEDEPVPDAADRDAVGVRETGRSLRPAKAVELGVPR